MTPTTTQITQALGKLASLRISYPADRLAARREAFRAQMAALNVEQFQREPDEGLLDPDACDIETGGVTEAEDQRNSRPFPGKRGDA